MPLNPPWKAISRGGIWSDKYNVTDKEGYYIARDECKERAMLIAAAPELLKALQKVISGYAGILVSEFGDESYGAAELEMARAAIAKATA